MTIDDLLLGTKLACVAITDDEEGTLAKVAKMNPWHTEALAMITGSEEEAHKPLTHILDRHFGLQVDKIINLTGWSGGHPIDTQGFIAHNDEMIVVSFRCTTSAMDWMTNFAATASEWELDEDLEQGHSGFCSCLEGRFFNSKPRVHTGFYNNILQTIPLLEKFVDPLLATGQPPRKLYVVGHSLGAGMSTMATLYFLNKHRWQDLPQRLINVSAGTPKSLKRDMAEKVESQLAELAPLNKAVVLRVVMNEDVVARVPFGYEHVGKLVFLTEDGHVLVGPRCDDAHVIDAKEMKEMAQAHPKLRELVASDDNNDEEEDTGGELTAYQKKMKKMPRLFRDHCPDCYLAPLVKLMDRRYE